MLLGDLLVAHGFCSHDDVQLALERQSQCGGLLGENLVALGKLTPAQLEQFLEHTPVAPSNLAESGLSESFLLSLAMKILYLRGIELPSKLAEAMGLSNRIATDLLGVA